MLHVPRFGADWEWPVLENTAAETLRKGRLIALAHLDATRPVSEGRPPGAVRLTPAFPRLTPCPAAAL